MAQQTLALLSGRGGKGGSPFPAWWGTAAMPGWGTPPPGLLTGPVIGRVFHKRVDFEDICHNIFPIISLVNWNRNITNSNMVQQCIT